MFILATYPGIFCRVSSRLVMSDALPRYRVEVIGRVWTTDNHGAALFRWLRVLRLLAQLLQAPGTEAAVMAYFPREPEALVDPEWRRWFRDKEVATMRTGPVLCALGLLPC